MYDYVGSLMRWMYENKGEMKIKSFNDFSCFLITSIILRHIQYEIKIIYYINR